MSIYDQRKNEIRKLLDEFEKNRRLANEETELLLQRREEAIKTITKYMNGIHLMCKQRQIGFPWLADAYSEAITLMSDEIANYLKHKPRPAIKAAEAVKQSNTERREAIRNLKIAEYQIAFYENIAPFLIDLKEELEVPTQEEINTFQEYSEDEQLDEATKFLSKEEYRKLSSTERNQTALDRFKNRNKSKALIGKIYERYVGYLFEKEGYKVSYQGIDKGLEDLGRDLICEKKNEVIVIQCKNWSSFKTIYEKHIFQFFGTYFQMKDKYPKKKVRAIFYTSTKLSDLARRFANELNIELKEEFKMDNDYPCIKCNISPKTKEKIYHLPFDQQYDKVVIEPEKGEFYCATVAEAEKKGFRRAFRYKANASKN